MNATMHTITTDAPPDMLHDYAVEHEQQRSVRRRAALEKLALVRHLLMAHAPVHALVIEYSGLGKRESGELEKLYKARERELQRQDRIRQQEELRAAPIVATIPMTESELSILLMALGDYESYSPQARVLTNRVCAALYRHEQASGEDGPRYYAPYLAEDFDPYAYEEA